MTSLQACGSVDPSGRQPHQQWRPPGGSASGRLQSGASCEEAAHRVAFKRPLSEALRSLEGSQSSSARGIRGRRECGRVHPLCAQPGSESGGP